MQSDERRCKKCGETKPLSVFPLYDAAKGARRHECKSCNTARVEGWHHEHQTHRLSQARTNYQRLKEVPGWYDAWLAKKRDREPVYLKRDRDAAFAAYGGYRCKCCGETEPKFLSIDHINNDGAEMRKVHGVGSAMYKWLKKRGYPAGFQVLCMNCNHGKARNGGVCPHQEGSTAIPQGSTVKRPEAPRPSSEGDDIA